ncbi:MAG: bifunctional alpha,alpha-trehalose-phosphate synthase (UDP-forming)/trehalose-phosphatase [Candidatus Desulfofervidaceae bacterium]|nr:bifunctional alpha,alpha-trehalose-phosphate synthase (UDP-forming)/trehalose-phosphatase [Candidatus Desulfofervidaceae bacterium]MDL1970696.1 bifunctional alpha,alpha-trehalose-phosphate synthase (UDP-forming)/trehalose-phosphatase [Candidatus Desulfofervidaceae bacterium]
MGNLIIVSNRLPFSVIKKNNRINFQTSAGGLATGLGSVYKAYNALWVGWPGIVLEKLKEKEKEQITEKLKIEHNYPIFLSQKDVDNYYHGFSNKILWPLFHYFSSYTSYSDTFWEAYKRVNKAFCKAVLNVATEDDVIWIHDYHLMLLPRLIREQMPKVSIGFFLHIPFPSFEIFRLLPWRREILEGMLGADLIGFHTYDYALHFLNSVRRLLGYEHTIGQIIADNRVIKVDTFPMGIDCEKFAQAVSTTAVKKEIKKIRKKIGERKVILSVDRLDYTKGIPQRLEAFETFLGKYPRYREKVNLVLVVVPSRIKVEYYMALKKQIDELVGRINGKYGTIGWVPVWYLYRCLSFHPLVALYNVADIALITPLRDGMNLIAKEFVASKTEGKGVLILSEMAGAVKELGEAIVINPNNKAEIVKAMKEALTMLEEEQNERIRIMQNRLQRYNIVKWANDFMDKLIQMKKVQQEVCGERLTATKKEKLINDYIKSSHRLILLDYDGTLVPFAERPERAKPDTHLLQLLASLAQEKKNEIVIISGRDKNTVEKWFGSLGIALIAEHGVWIKEKNGTWEMIEPLQNDWKEEIKPVLETYVDRTPGSFIEEKEYSLVWHYRKADPELTLVRARELKDALLHLTTNLNLGILEGNKVIEVKNVGINKGRAALKWTSKQKWDFILAIGDDWTDEDVFLILPERAYSIKVGIGYSKAKFTVPSYRKVRELLKELKRCEIERCEMDILDVRTT